MESPKNICPNCNNILPSQANFCPSCSQKVRSGKITVREFFKEFTDTVFNLDSKLFQTLGALFIPGKLTKQYFAGKRKSYAPPLRIFIILLVSFLTVMSIYENNESALGKGLIPYGKEKNKEKEMLKWMELTKKEMNEAFASPDSNLVLLDTFTNWFEKKRYFVSQTHSFLYFNHQENRFDNIKIDTEDIINFTPKQIMEKHEITGFFNEVLITRMAKFTKDPLALSRFFLGSFTWMALLLLPFMALVLKLLYRKSNHYFIEHLVFLYHVHSFWFLSGVVLIFLGKWLPSFVLTMLGIGMGVYFLLALKNVYGKSWRNTVLNFMLFLIFYCIAFSLFVILFGMISFFLF